MFVCIFVVAKWPMDWIGAGKDALRRISSAGPHGRRAICSSLVTDGIIGGVGNGRRLPASNSHPLLLPRSARGQRLHGARRVHHGPLMSRVGLHGKSFVPLLSSFACAIPGIMATRTIENRNDRFVTILVAPLMSVLRAAARLCADDRAAHARRRMRVGRKAGIMLIMYLLGIAAAFGMAWHFQKDDPAQRDAHAPARAPTVSRARVRGIVQRMWERAVSFSSAARAPSSSRSASSSGRCCTIRSPRCQGADAFGILSHSIGGRCGHAIEPVIAPLGYDWKIGIGLVGIVRRARSVREHHGRRFTTSRTPEAENEDRCARMMRRRSVGPTARPSSRRSCA